MDDGFSTNYNLDDNLKIYTRKNSVINDRFAAII